MSPVLSHTVILQIEADKISFPVVKINWIKFFPSTGCFQTNKQTLNEMNVKHKIPLNRRHTFTFANAHWMSYGIYICIGLWELCTRWAFGGMTWSLVQFIYFFNLITLLELYTIHLRLSFSNSIFLSFLFKTFSFLVLFVFQLHSFARYNFRCHGNVVVYLLRRRQWAKLGAREQHKQMYVQIN